MGEWLAYTFVLTGRREWGHGTQGVALGSGLVGLSARAGPQTRLFPYNLHQLNISILNTLPFKGAIIWCSFTPSLRCSEIPCLAGLQTLAVFQSSVRQDSYVHIGSR